MQAALDSATECLIDLALAEDVGSGDLTARCFVPEDARSCARIAAREKPFVAGIALTAGHWDLAAFQAGVLERIRREQKAVAQSNFQFQGVVGAADPDEAIVIAKDFGVGTIAHEIAIPFLVTHGANDRIIPVANARKLYDAIPASTPATNPSP